MPYPLGPLTRDEVVGIVKEIIGDVNGAERGRHSELGVFRPMVRGIKLQFTLNHSEILGEYIVPIPPEVLAIVLDSQRNPYNSASVRCEAVLEAVLPAPLPVSAEPSEPDAHQ